MLRIRTYKTPRHLLTVTLFFACFGIENLGSSQCSVLPGMGNPYRSGLHRISTNFRYSDTPEPHAVVWLQDGRVAVGYTGFSSFAPKRGVIRMYHPVSTQLRDQGYISPP